MNNKKLPYINIISHLSLLTAGVIWAASGPIIKLTLEHVPAGTFLFFRFLLVCILLLPFLIMELKKVNYSKTDIINIIIIGLLSQSSLYVLFISYKYTGALDVTIIGVMAAIASIWLGNHFYKEKIDKKLTIGLILAVIGTFIVVIEPVMKEFTLNVNMHQKIFGNLMAILYNVFWVAYLVFSKIIMGKKSLNLKKDLSVLGIKKDKNSIKPFIITATSFYVGLATMIPVAIYEYLNNDVYFNILNISTTGLFGILYMAFFGSIVGYIAYQFGLKYVKISDTAIYGYLQPVMTIPFAYYLLNETPNNYMIIGGVIIALGVIVAESKNN